MDRRFLAEQLAAGRSLEQIGALVGKHPSTVGYWLQKHGLVATNHAKNAPKGTIDPDLFGELVSMGLTRAELAAQLGISGSTVTYWLRKLRLRTKRGRRIVENQNAREAGVRSLHRHCRIHGFQVFALMRRGTYECVRCKSDAVSRRRRRVKEILVKESGGRCRRCGFAEHQAALQFHHLDPATKSFSLSAQGVTRSLAKARAEVKKCILLCANCHALVEAGAVNL
jgi:DNA-binding transcriptional ArsR family regulator